MGSVFEGVFGLWQGTGHPQKELTVGAGEEVDWCGAGDDALHFGAFALYWIEVCGVAFAVEGAEQTYQVAAGRAARGTDAVCADAVGLGIVPDEADGALDVFDRGRVTEAGERTVVHCEDGVAAGGEGLGVELRLAVGLEGRGVVGEGRGPAAARDVDDAVAVGLGGLVYVEEECRAGVHAINNVAFDGEGVGCCGDGCQQDCQCQGAHGQGQPITEVGACETVGMPGTFKMIELVGTSPISFAEAVKSAVAEAAKTVRHMDWFEVVNERGRIEDGQVTEFQVTIKIGFKIER